MRVNKNKKNKRILEFYKSIYNITEPYQILVDGSFVFAALKGRLYIKEHLSTLLNGHAVPYVTNCIVEELKSMGEEVSGTLVIVKHYQKLKCCHEDVANSRDCIMSVLKNTPNLFIATHDTTLISWIRKIVGIPIIKLKNNILVLESPSSATLKHKLNMDKEKIYRNYKIVKEEKVSKKRKKKNPNPLSCLKKKKKVTNE